MPVAHGKQYQPALLEVANAKVGDVPTEAAVNDLLNFILPDAPLFRVPKGKLGQIEAALLRKLFCVRDDFVDE
jgi:hypothetical protein